MVWAVLLGWHGSWSAKKSWWITVTAGRRSRSWLVSWGLPWARGWLPECLSPAWRFAEYSLNPDRRERSGLQQRVDAEFPQQVGQGDQWQANQAVWIPAFHFPEQGDAQAFHFEAARAVVGLFLVQVVFDFPGGQVPEVDGKPFAVSFQLAGSGIQNGEPGQELHAFSAAAGKLFPGYGMVSRLVEQVAIRQRGYLV